MTVIYKLHCFTDGYNTGLIDQSMAQSSPFPTVQCAVFPTAQSQFEFCSDVESGIVRVLTQVLQ